MEISEVTARIKAPTHIFRDSILIHEIEELLKRYKFLEFGISEPVYYGEV